MTMAEGFLARALGNINITDFARMYLGKRHALVTGSPDRFSHLIDWGDVEAMLEDRYYAAEQVLIKKDGAGGGILSAYPELRTISRHDPTYIDTAAVTERLREGATLICNNVCDRVRMVADVCADIQYELGCRAWANAYIAPPSSTSGFGRHFDNHDVLVVQVDGAKRWTLYESDKTYPIDERFDPSTSSDAILWTGQVNAGDMLFVPRGVWHDVGNCGEASLHLTIGIETDRAVDFLRFVVDASTTLAPLLRTDIPYDDDPETLSHYLDLLRREMVSRIDEKSLEAFKEYQTAQLTTAPRFSLPFALRPNPEPLPSGAIIKAVRRDLDAKRVLGDDLVVGRGRRGVRLPATVSPLIDILAERAGIEMTLVDLGKFWEGDTDDFQNAVRQLVNTGLVQLVPEQEAVSIDAAD